MKKQIDKALALLDSRSRSVTAEEIVARVGEDGYRAVLAAAETDALTDRQLGNVLLLLMRLRGFGSHDRLLTIVERRVSHPAIAVRSVAARVLVRLLQAKGDALAVESSRRRGARHTLEEALGGDLDTETNQLVESFLEGSLRW